MNNSGIIVEVSGDAIASCGSCQARNYDSEAPLAVGNKVDTLYRVKVGSQTFNLCEACVQQMIGALTRAGKVVV